MNHYEREFAETNYKLIFDTSDYYKKGMNKSGSMSWSEHAAWAAVLAERDGNLAVANYFKTHNGFKFELYEQMKNK